MVGNAAEEGLLGQVGNPSHSDPSRVVALAAFAAGGIAYLLARWFIPALTVWGGIVFALAVCLSLAWGFSVWIRQNSKARQVKVMAARRAAETTITEQQIAAMHRHTSTGFGPGKGGA